MAVVHVCSRAIYYCATTLELVGRAQCMFVYTRNYMQLHQRQDEVCKADYAALRKEFEVEREQHLKTQAQVAVLSEKLHLAEGEARMLSKQLEKEKETFDNA